MSLAFPMLALGAILIVFWFLMPNTNALVGVCGVIFVAAGAVTDAITRRAK